MSKECKTIDVDATDFIVPAEMIIMQLRLNGNDPVRVTNILCSALGAMIAEHAIYEKPDDEVVDDMAHDIKQFTMAYRRILAMRTATSKDRMN